MVGGVPGHQETPWRMPGGEYRDRWVAGQRRREPQVTTLVLRGKRMNIVRVSELAPAPSDAGVTWLRLVTSEHGAETMTAGVITFDPGTGLVPHIHPCEETVIIIDGKGTVHVEGRDIPLATYDTSIIQPGVPHFFSNESDRPMTIAYFYP